MSHIYSYFHFVWSTEGREPFLNSPELRKAVWQHILENGRTKGLHIDFVGGYSDHCHCLLSLGSAQTIEQVAMLIKGESSHWINQQKLTQGKFAWQKEYFACVVAKSHLLQTRNYIRNQEEHHHKRSFQEEYDALIQAYGLDHP